MTTRPDPIPKNSGPHQPSDASSSMKRFLVIVTCLTAAADPVDRWLDVLYKAAETFERLKSSGLIDMVTGG
ncbi:hypothetical protein ACFT2C_05165 [Promicromonospora sp. NPDC057138]|uniref:hypothetical protein n=1 Tax=Promicromonospora sp. NPDC057138 TaxID=3346031 RepID=UPI00363CE490